MDWDWPSLNFEQPSLRSNTQIIAAIHLVSGFQCGRALETCDHRCPFSSAVCFVNKFLPFPRAIYFSCNGQPCVTDAPQPGPADRRPAPGARRPVSRERKVTYSVMVDRFANGDISNDRHNIPAFQIQDAGPSTKPKAKPKAVAVL